MTCFTLGLSRLSCHELNSQLERPVPAVKPTCAVFPVMEGISIRNDCVICVFKAVLQDHLQGHAIVGQCYKKLMPRVQIHAEGGKLDFTPDGIRPGRATTCSSFLTARPLRLRNSEVEGERFSVCNVPRIWGIQRFKRQS